MRKWRHREPAQTQAVLFENRGCPQATARRSSLLPLGLVALLATLPFLNTFGNDFAFDDKLAIVENPLIKHLQNIPTLFASGYWAQSPRMGKLYRPLVTSSYAINYALGGLQPLGYHLLNLMLHLGVCLLLYRLALRLFHHREGALVAAALFAVHPLHTEAVTGIVGRAEVCAAFFFLLAWWWDLEGGGRWRYVAGSLVAFGLALLSKEHAVALPAVLVLSDLYTAKARDGQAPPGPAWRLSRLASRYGGYLAVLIGYLLMRFAAIGLVLPRPIFLDNPLAHVGHGPPRLQLPDPHRDDHGGAVVLPPVGGLVSAGRARLGAAVRLAPRHGSLPSGATGGRGPAGGAPAAPCRPDRPAQPGLAGPCDPLSARPPGRAEQRQGA
jgi:hypothetical protein